MVHWTYRVIEYDPAKPWLIIGTSELRTVELPDDQAFGDWAMATYPAPRWQASLDPPGQERAAVLRRLHAEAG